MAKAAYQGPAKALELYEAVVADTESLQPWFDESHDWIGTLKPKPTKRKKT